MYVHSHLKTRVCGIAIEDQAILLIRYDYPNECPLWHIPDGGAESGEMLTGALQREFLEELNIAVDVGELWFVGNSVRSNDGGQVLHLVFDIHRASRQEPELQPEHTSGQRFDWIPLNDLPAMRLYPNIGTQICQLASKRKAFSGTQNLGHILDIY